MAYSINPRVRSVQPPPIAETWNWISGRDFPPDKPLLDVAQAVPTYPPALPLRDHLATLVRENGAFTYTEILGLPGFRQDFATHLSGQYAAGLTGEQVAITAGCNQAFCLVLSALAQAGDEAILPAPYYFNHTMWLEMQGVKPVLLPFDEAAGGVPDPDAAAELVTERTRAIVLVTPNNPTGATYSPEVLNRFYDLAQQHRIALILDESYKDFLKGGDFPGEGANGTPPPHKLFQRFDWADTLVQLYSFSKAYSLAGYRVGAITAGRALLEEIAKVADCVTICPPRIGQEAAWFGLNHLAGWREDNRRAAQARMAALTGAMEAHAPNWRVVSAGAFFAYIRHPFDGEPAAAVAKRLAENEHLLCLPGSIFGPGQDAYLRIAFANLEAGRMAELAKRMARLEDG